MSDPYTATDLRALLRNIAQNGTGVWHHTRALLPRLGAVPLPSLENQLSVLTAASELLISGKVRAFTSREDEFFANVRRMSFGARWSVLGRPVFSPSRALVARSVLTSYEGVETSAFRLPFDTFALDLDAVADLFPCATPESPDDSVVLVLVRREEPLTTSIMERFEDYCAARLTMFAHMMTTHVRPFMATLDPADVAEAFTFQFITRHRALFEIVVAIPSDTAAPLRSWYYRALRDAKAEGEVPLMMVYRGVMDLLVGLAMHLRDAPRAEWNPERHKVLGRKTAAKFDPVVWNLGSTITLDLRLFSAAREKVRGTESAAWKEHASHVVMGHWKHQPHGAGRAERKWIHVSAYMRGNADAEPRPHAYEVK